MAFVLNGVTFNIENTGVPTVEASGTQVRFHAQYRVDWGSRYSAINSLIGSATAVAIPGAGGGLAYLSRTSPHTPTWDPELQQFLWCRSVRGTPHGPLAATHTRPEFKDYIIDATYENLPYRIITDDEAYKQQATTAAGPQGPPSPYDLGPFGQIRNVVAHPKDRAELKSVFGGLVYSDTGKTVQNGLGVFPLTKTDYTFTWYGVPEANAPLQDARAMVGGVNADQFWLFPPGSAWLKEVDYEYAVQPVWFSMLPSLPKTVNMKYVIGFNYLGWNNFPDVERNYRYFPVQRADGSPLFRAVYLNALFWARV